jgi:predicted phosphodiesterase
MIVNEIKSLYRKAKDFYFLLVSDLHIDSPGFDKKLALEYFDEAVEKQARIFINGDTVSVILKNDKKRYMKSVDKYRNDNALNEITEEAIEFLKPYVNYIDVIGVGNHEVSIMKYHDYDIIRQVVMSLNKMRDKNLEPIRQGGYQGFIRLNFWHDGKSEKSAKRYYDIFYNHGQGGQAEITKGMIDIARREYIDADLIWLGHKHKFIQDNDMPLIWLDREGRIRTKHRRGLITGSFKSDLRAYDIEEEGYKSSFGLEKMRTLESKGAAFLKINISGGNLKSRIIT